jgi:hypothetical protein
MKVAALSEDQGPDSSGTQEELVPGQRQSQHHENDTAQPGSHENDSNTSEVHTASNLGPTSPKPVVQGPQKAQEDKQTHEIEFKASVKWFEKILTENRKSNEPLALEIHHRALTILRAQYGIQHHESDVG